MGSSRAPLYRQLEAALAEAIRSGRYRPGEQLPSSRDLARERGVSMITVKRALRDLAEQGLIETVPAKGSFVRRDLAAASPADTDGADESARWRIRPVAHDARKRIRLHVLGELESYGHLWRGVADRFGRAHPDCAVELVGSDAIGPPEPYVRDAEILQFHFDGMQAAAKAGLVRDPGDGGGLGHEPSAFYPAAGETVEVDGTARGVPITMATECLLYNREVEDIVAPLGDGAGFWEFWKNLADLAPPCRRRGFEAVLGNDLAYTFLLELIRPHPPRMGMDSLTLRDAEDRRAMERLEPHLRREDLVLSGRPGAAPPYRAFRDGRTALLLTYTYLLPLLGQEGAPLFGVLPLPHEPDTGPSADGFVNVLSAFTPFVEEGTALLRALGTRETQAAFARAGRLVARRDAMEDFRFPGLDGADRDALRRSLEHGRTRRWQPPASFEFVLEVANHEVTRWLRGEADLDGLAAVLERKGRYWTEAWHRRADRPEAE